MSSSTGPSFKRTAALLALVVILAFASVVGMALFQKARAVSDETYEYMAIFNQVLTIVQKDYVKEVEAKDLIYGAIKGMLATLDPHTVFIPKEDYQQVREDISGQFGGLGIHITKQNGRLTIISPIEGTPAWKEGLKPGDWIVEIEGESTAEMTLTDAVHLMRGPVGEPITISILREGFEEPREFTIIRDLIQIPSVSKHELMKSDIAYLKISTFNEKTYDEMKDAVRELAEQAAGGFKGLILDLRNNPGGPLNQAVLVADMFLAEGVIVSVRGRNEVHPPEYAREKGTIEDVPMVVLVNQASASASEIVAGALQDHGRAVILGKTTFGKGSVQQLRTIKDGSGLKITTAYYYTPSGRSIQEEGIKPDIEVDELSPEQKLELSEKDKEERRRYLRERDLKRHFSREDVMDGEGEDDSGQEQRRNGEDVLPEEVGQDTEDYQLQRALDLLRSFEIFQAVLKKKAT